MVKYVQGASALEDPHNWCHRECERNYTKWYEELDKSMCKARCNSIYGAPEYHSQESAPIATNETLKNIGDSFYGLADSVSVL